MLARMNEGEADERSLGGKTRLWNITHFNGIRICIGIFVIAICSIFNISCR